MKQKEMAFVYVILGILFLPVVWFSYWSFWPMTGMEFSSVKVLTPTVCPGDFLEYSVEVKKHVDVPGQLCRQLVSTDGAGYVINLPQTIGDMPPGKHFIVNRFQIPYDLKPGNFFVRNVAIHEVNAVRTLYSKYIIPEFTVKSRKDCE